MLKFFLILFFPFLTAAAFGQQREELHSAEELQAYTLSSTTGNKTISLLSNTKPYSVLVFLSPECPLCKNYSVVLEKISLDFKDKAAFVGVFPGVAYSENEIEVFRKKYGISFPLVMDTAMTWAKKLQISVTPEVVVLDKEGSLVYRGAIDDWAINPGKQRIHPSQAYLYNALQASVKGLTVFPRITQPVGCFINDY